MKNITLNAFIVISATSYHSSPVAEADDSHLGRIGVDFLNSLVRKLLVCGASLHTANLRCISFFSGDFHHTNAFVPTIATAFGVTEGLVPPHSR
jgi:hypothetical protein